MGQARAVALLRGVNVGGKNKLPMKDLCAFFVDAGCTEVKNYIQSGNVIFRADAKVLKSLPGTIEARISERFGFSLPVILRTHEEIAKIVRENPYVARGDDEKQLHVVFLRDVPARDLVDALDPQRSPPDEFTVRGGEIYLSLVNGAAKTKLTNAWMDSKLKTISTGRNWRTVLTLYSLSGPE